MITEDNITNNKVEIPINQLLGQVPTLRHHQLRGANHHFLDDTGRLQGFQPLKPLYHFLGQALPTKQSHLWTFLMLLSVLINFFL